MKTEPDVLEDFARLDEDRRKLTADNAAYTWHTLGCDVARAALNPEPAASKEPQPAPRIGTHWSDCWRAHHACAVAEVEKLGAWYREAQKDLEHTHPAPQVDVVADCIREIRGDVDDRTLIERLVSIQGYLRHGAPPPQMDVERGQGGKLRAMRKRLRAARARFEGGPSYEVCVEHDEPACGACLSGVLMDLDALLSTEKGGGK